MDWIIGLAFLGFLWWLARRAGERTSELAATGIMRSPLYWASNALVVVLIALVLYIIRTRVQSPVPAFLWFAVFANVVVLLVLRRALKWRYPV
jgi:hypothetical protein